MEKLSEGLINIFRVWAQRDDLDVVRGMNAFSALQSICEKAAEEYGVSARTATAVFAVLSPNNGYRTNILDLEKMLQWWAQERERTDVQGSLDLPKISTYPANRRKAMEILQTANVCDPITLLKGNKVLNFYRCILDPRNSFNVVVDAHVYSAWKGQRFTVKSRELRITSRAYFLCSEDYREFAKIERIRPMEVAAVIWYTWKKIHRIVDPAQLNLYPGHRWEE